VFGQQRLHVKDLEFLLWVLQVDSHRGVEQSTPASEGVDQKAVMDMQRQTASGKRTCAETATATATTLTTTTPSTTVQGEDCTA